MQATWHDVQVKCPCSGADLRLIEPLAQPADNGLISVRRAGQPAASGNVPDRRQAPCSRPSTSPQPTAFSKKGPSMTPRYKITRVNEAVFARTVPCHSAHTNPILIPPQTPHTWSHPMMLEIERHHQYLTCRLNARRKEIRAIIWKPSARLPAIPRFKPLPINCIPYTSLPSLAPQPDQSIPSESGAPTPLPPPDPHGANRPQYRCGGLRHSTPSPLTKSYRPTERTESLDPAKLPAISLKI